MDRDLFFAERNDVYKSVIFQLRTRLGEEMVTVARTWNGPDWSISRSTYFRCSSLFPCPLMGLTSSHPLSRLYHFSNPFKTELHSRIKLSVYIGIELKSRARLNHCRQILVAVLRELRGLIISMEKKNAPGI